MRHSVTFYETIRRTETSFYLSTFRFLTTLIETSFKHLAVGTVALVILRNLLKAQCFKCPYFQDICTVSIDHFFFKTFE